MPSVKNWTRVPDRSTLQLEFDGDTAIVRRVLTVSDGTTQDLNGDASAEPISLRTPLLYSVTLILTFAQASTMTVKAHVELPGGNQHSDPFEEPVTGAAGEVKTVALGVITLQS